MRLIDKFNIPKGEKYPKRHIILRRRRQILVHSYIYYELNESIISDNDFDRWCKELVELQAKYKGAAKKVDYHEEFKNFDGSTGYHLDYKKPEIMFVAYKLLGIDITDIDKKFEQTKQASLKELKKDCRQ